MTIHFRPCPFTKPEATIGSKWPKNMPTELPPVEPLTDEEIAEGDRVLTELFGAEWLAAFNAECAGE